MGGLLIFSMAGCGSSSTTPAASPEASSSTVEASSNTETAESQAPAAEEVVKPEKITMMVDKTFLTPEQGQDKVTEKFKELTGVELDVTSIDHNSYKDQIALAFASGDVADVVILSAEYYPAYANQGALADITEYWDNSESKASGRIAEQYIDSLRINDRLYAFTAARGNGCITYLRQDWLDKLGLSVPTTYDEYINVLKAFTENDPDGNGQNDTYGVTAAGIISGEAPWTNYLPEFWQDSYPDFYQKEDGTWVDGFSEQATSDALQRLKDAYNLGVIDMEVTTNKTSSCRDKFYAGNCGAFTYWAGKWNMTLEQNVQNLFPDAKLVAVPAIKELGHYLERQSPVVAITNKCENPAGVFKYLFETMIDGGEGQKLFCYGAEGTHWEMKDGVFTQLPDLENPKNTFQSAFIDPVLCISKWTTEDPLASTRDERILTSSQEFLNTAELAPMIVSNDTMANYAASIKDIRTVIVADVVTGETSVEDGMASYHEQTDAMVAEILASLGN